MEYQKAIRKLVVKDFSENLIQNLDKEKKKKQPQA
jgi:hypothetical protein